MENGEWSMEHGTWMNTSEAIYDPSAKRSMIHQRSDLCPISVAILLKIPL